MSIVRKTSKTVNVFCKRECELHERIKSSFQRVRFVKRFKISTHQQAYHCLFNIGLCFTFRNVFLIYAELKEPFSESIYAIRCVSLCFPFLQNE